MYFCYRFVTLHLFDNIVKLFSLDSVDLRYVRLRCNRKRVALLAYENENLIDFDIFCCLC